MFMDTDLQKKVESLKKRKDCWTPQPVQFKSILTNHKDLLAGRAPGSVKVRQVAVGAVHVIAIAEGDNLVMAWGKNSSGQLGIGSVADQVFRPTKIKSFGRDRDM